MLQLLIIDDKQTINYAISKASKTRYNKQEKIGEEQERKKPKRNKMGKVDAEKQKKKEKICCVQNRLNKKLFYLTIISANKKQHIHC